MADKFRPQSALILNVELTTKEINVKLLFWFRYGSELSCIHETLETQH